MAAVMAELCPPQIYMLKPESPVSQNVPVLGDGAFEEAIKLNRVIRVGSSSI